MKDFVLPPWRTVRVLGSALVLALLAATPVLAQFGAGNVYGRVVDQQDQVLPGVTVTLSGIGAPQVFLSNSEGRFRFLNLPPGRYSLKAELAGFSTVTRGNVDVNVGRNTDIEVVLSPAVAQTITVTAETPLIDVRRTGTGSTVTQIEMQEVPTARDPWVVMQQVPGVLMDRLNVGGNESGQQSGYVSKGATDEQSTWNVDGVNITDMASMSSPNYYDFDSFEEMQVTTGGTDPRIGSPGVQLNMVTKRGTNEFRGSARFFLVEDEWQAEATLPDDDKALYEPHNARDYLARGNEISSIEDYGLEAGGPLMRDRLWLWGAYSKNQIDSFTAQPPEALRYSDDTTLENWNGKLNAQISSNNSATFLYTYGNKIKLGRNVGPTRPPETGWNQSGPTDMYKLEDTHIFSPNFYLSGLVSIIESPFMFDPAGGLDTQVWNDPDGVFHGSYYFYSTDRPQRNYRADASTFFDTGNLNHELKFGFGYRDTQTSSTSTWPGNNTVAFLYEDGPGAAGGAAFYRDGANEMEQQYTDIYAGDTIQWGNLTLQIGLRYDLAEGKTNRSSVAANPVIPDVLSAATFEGGDPVEWSEISPRIGATYALGPNRRTLIRAAYDRYADTLSGIDNSRTHPFYYYQYLYFYFTDVNGDKVVQPAEVDTSYLVSFYLVDPDDPNSGQPLYRWDPNIDAPTTDEFILGFEHALRPEFTIGINFTHREFNDLIWYRPEQGRGSGDLYTSADYELAGTLTGPRPDGETYSVPYYRSTVGNPIYYVIQNRPDYKQEFDGIELNATKRMSNRWMMRANISWNDWKQKVGPKGIFDPTADLSSSGCPVCDDSIVVNGSGEGSGAKGGVYINSRWSYIFTGVFELPWDINLGASIQGREGYPIPYFHRVFEDGYTKEVLIDDVDAVRHDDIFQADLRLAKQFKWRDLGLTVSLDAFNITDERTILQREHRLYRARTRPDLRANQIEETQSPRVFRAGARLTF